MIGRAAALLAIGSTVQGARIQQRKPGTLATCGAKGASAPGGQIVNGEDATECEWRWQAQFKKDGDFFCGGSLITPEWVLTAAHCVRLADFDVVLGDHDMSKTSIYEQKRSAVMVVWHPGYDYHGNDLALVKLDSPVTMTECVGTVCLPEAGRDVAAGTSCWITGWGTLKAEGPGPNILQEAKVGTISPSDCCNKFSYNCTDPKWKIDDRMICAQGVLPDGRISDGCQGDSGGPLVCEENGQWTLYGATSFAKGCAVADYPGVWANVHEELEWIEETLAGNIPTPAPTPPCPPDTSKGPDAAGDCECNGGWCYEDGVMGCTFSYTAEVSWYKSTTHFLPTCSGCECKSR